MSRKYFGTFLFLSGLISIFSMLISIYFVVLPDLSFFISLDIYLWILGGPLSRPLNILGSILSIIGWVLVTFYLIFGYMFTQQVRDPSLSQFWNKILIGSIILVANAILGFVWPLFVDFGTIDINVYTMLLQLFNGINLILSLVAYIFLTMGWNDYTRYSQHRENQNSTISARKILFGYKVLVISIISDLILMGISFIVLLLPISGEIFSYIYFTITLLIDVTAVIVARLFLLVGQIKLGSQLRNTPQTTYTEPTLGGQQYRPPSISSPQRPSTTTKHCGNCGTPVELDAKFCPYCGSLTK
jgi:hypothetical protein